MRSASHARPAAGSHILLEPRALPASRHRQDQSAVSPAQPTDFIRPHEFVEEEVGEREKSEHVYALVGRRDELGVKCSKSSFWLPANKLAD